MSRPFTKQESITYHHSDAEDTETIVDIARKYGDRLEKLDSTQRASLLCEIANALMERSELLDEVISPAPNWLLDQIEILSRDTLCALAAAATEQLRADLKHQRSDDQ